MNNIEFFLGDLKTSNYNLSFINDVKNLIKESKKLKEEKKLAYNLGYRNGCNDTSKFNDKEFIRKSKVKDKIEEIKVKMNNDCIALHGFQREAQIDILQELLEGE